MVRVLKLVSERTRQRVNMEPRFHEVSDKILYVVFHAFIHLQLL
jgi:hypothetical protein